MSEFRKAIADLLQNRAETGCCLALVLKHFQTEFAAENLILNRYYSLLQGIEDHKSIDNFIFELQTISLAVSNTFKMISFGGVTIYKINPLKLNENVKNRNVDYSISIASWTFIFGGWLVLMSSSKPPNMSFILHLQMGERKIEIITHSFTHTEQWVSIVLNIQSCILKS